MQKYMIIFSLLFSSYVVLGMNNQRNARKILFPTDEPASAHRTLIPSNYSIHFDYPIDNSDTTDLPKPNFNFDTNNNHNNLISINEKNKNDNQPNVKTPPSFNKKNKEKGVSEPKIKLLKKKQDTKKVFLLSLRRTSNLPSPLIPRSKDKDTFIEIFTTLNLKGNLIEEFAKLNFNNNNNK